VVPKEEQIGSDAGSRQGRCPVCDRTNDAEDEYNTAIARATEAYNRIVNRAWEKKEDEKASANYVIETVSYSVHLCGNSGRIKANFVIQFPYRRNREHHRHRYSGYASSMIE